MENVAKTTELVKAAHDKGLSIEAEVGSAAVKHQGHVAGLLLNGVQSLKTQTLPVLGILAVDVADACWTSIIEKVKNLNKILT